MDVEFQFWKKKGSASWLHNSVNVLDTTKLYI